MTDRELLDAYATQDSHQAFRTLVERHASMVHAACLRVLRNVHAAEDASQATFMVLARKASRLSKRENLAGWLYLTAITSAKEFRRQEHRRRQREQRAMTMQTEANSEANWDTVSVELDAALAGLPRAQRDVLVLRYLRGYSEAEAAAELGCTRGTLSARLSRALHRLRDALHRRGIHASGAVLAVLLAENAAPAAPAGLVSSLHAACLGTTAVDHTALAITEGVMRTLFWTKVKTVALWLGAVTVVSASVPVAIHHVWSGEARGVLTKQAAPQVHQAWRGKQIAQLALDATQPCWSPDGRTIAYAYCQGKAPRGMPIPGGRPKPRQARERGVAFVDLASGTRASVVIAKNAPSFADLVWQPDGKALLVVAGTKIWRVAYQRGKAEAALFKTLAEGTAIASLDLDPRGKYLLCQHSLPAQGASQRQDIPHVILDIQGEQKAAFKGKQCLWDAKRHRLLFSQGDRLCALDLPDSKTTTLISPAAYLRTRGERAPEADDKRTFEFWPRAVYEDGTVLVEFVHIAKQASPPPGRIWKYDGELFTWKPNGAVINGKRRDHYQRFALTNHYQIRFVPVDDTGLLLRLESRTDVNGYYMKRFVAMTVDARSGQPVRIFGLPQSVRERNRWQGLSWRLLGLDQRQGVALLLSRLFGPVSKNTLVRLRLSDGTMQETPLPAAMGAGWGSRTAVQPGGSLLLMTLRYANGKPFDPTTTVLLVDLAGKGEVWSQPPAQPKQRTAPKKEVRVF